MLNNAIDIINKAQSIYVQKALYLASMTEKPDIPTVTEETEKEFQQANQEIIQHIPEIQQTIELWHDKVSMVQYANFLTYSLLDKLDKNLALTLDQNYPAQLSREMQTNLHKIILNNGLTIPKLTITNGKSTDYAEALVCGFAMQQYRYPHWVDLDKNDVFIDCGAFIGDTSIWAWQKGATVHTIEPIPDNIADIKINLSQNGFPTNLCYNYAVGANNQKTVIKMLNKHKAGSFIPAKEKTFATEAYLKKFTSDIVDIDVQCVRLDDFFHDNNITPTFIKMDIEGFELDALKGAEQTIKQLRPKLAICLYHKYVDLWEIPLYLKSIVPEYKFFCRENNKCCEFVLYATTGEKY